MAKHKIIKVSRDQFRQHAEKKQAGGEDGGGRRQGEDILSISPLELSGMGEGAFSIEIPSDRAGLERMLEDLQARVEVDAAMRKIPRENVTLLRRLHQTDPTLSRRSEDVRLQRDMATWSNEECIQFLSDASSIQINARPAYYFAVLRQVMINGERKTE